MGLIVYKKLLAQNCSTPKESNNFANTNGETQKQSVIAQAGA